MEVNLPDSVVYKGTGKSTVLSHCVLIPVLQNPCCLIVQSTNSPEDLAVNLVILALSADISWFSTAEEITAHPQSFVPCFT